MHSYFGIPLPLRSIAIKSCFSYRSNYLTKDSHRFRNYAAAIMNCSIHMESQCLNWCQKYIHCICFQILFCLCVWTGVAGSLITRKSCFYSSVARLNVMTLERLRLWEIRETFKKYSIYIEVNNRCVNQKQTYQLCILCMVDMDDHRWLDAPK